VTHDESYRKIGLIAFKTYWWGCMLNAVRESSEKKSAVFNRLA